MDRENRLVLKSYTVRLPDDVIQQLERCREDRSSKTGKNVPLSDVFREALGYGIPMYQSETNHHIPLPVRMTKTQRMAHYASELVLRGLASLDSGPVPDSAI